MWTVLLVEDEVFVRESIKEMMDWEEMGFTVIGEAGNGKEALHFIHTKQPDVVITDILMPVMDGVELLKQTRAAGYQCKFVILSCMNEFEYVRQAMEYGASNYILKLSMSVQSLRDTLQKVKKELIQESAQYLQRTPELYETLWQKVIANKIEKANQPALTIPALARSHQLIIIVVLHGNETFTWKDLNIIDIQSTSDSVLHVYEKWGMTSLFFWSPDSIETIVELLQNSSYPITHSPIINGEDLVTGWYSCINQLNEFWYQDTIGVRGCSLNDVRESNQSISWEAERIFFQLFEQMKEKELHQQLINIWDEIEKMKLNMVEVKEIAQGLDKTMSRMVDRPASLEDILNSRSHSHLFDILETQMTDKLSHWKKLHMQLTDHPEINKVKHYIQQHYEQPITVKSLAKYVAMDESYLSGLFKRKTGQTVIQYLHQVRVNQAKNLLRQTDMPINQIGEKVGFVHNNYFNKIFKRITNQTPKEFRTSGP